MKKKAVTMLAAYFESRKTLLENKIAAAEKNGLTAEEIQTLKDDLQRINELVSTLQEGDEGDDIEEVRKKIVEEISKRQTDTFNECKEYVENAFRLMNIMSEGKDPQKQAKKFAKVYENQIKLLQTQLGMQVFKNAITITPAGSLPVPTGVAMAEPAVILPKIFDYAEESIGTLTGDFRGAKLRVLVVTHTGNQAGAIAEGVNKPLTDATITATDVEPLKVAVVIENVTVEQIEFNDWLEDVLKIFATKLLFNNLEAAAVNVLDTNSTAYDGTSAAATVTEAFLENVAVAGASQLAAANYYGQKVAFVNEADWVNNLNAQTTTAYPVENKKIAEHIQFVASGAVPAGTMYVADARYLKKKMYKDVFVERAVSHTHSGTGARLYPNATDYIFDALAFFFVEDAKAVIKLNIAATMAVIVKP